MSTESEITSSSSSPAPESSSAPTDQNIPPLNQAAADGGLTPPLPTDRDNVSTNPNMVVGGPKPVAEQIHPGTAEEAAPSPIAAPSPGKPAFDRSSLRETEIFDSADIVFVREGANGVLVPYPTHEADARFSVVTKRESNFRTHDGKTLTALELENGDKVSIEGTTVIVTPADGPAEIATPDLNAKGPSENQP